MMGRLERILGCLPAGDALAPTIVDEAPLDGVRGKRVSVDKEQAHLLLGFPGARVTDDDRHALEMIAAILGGQSGRLFLDLRDRQGLAYSVTAWSQEAVDPGFFAVYIGTEKSKLRQARAGMHHHLERICEERVPDEEIDRAARYLAGAFEIGLQRGGAVATRILFDELYGIGHDALHDYPDRILSVTADDIQGAAQRRLTLGRHVELTLVPSGR
jgi:zinc protease